ncbi:MAG: hypothetical protein Q7T71_01705 [Herbiconiux sp.]|nr:hypothetical protein [Herbiconiux sp.]
MTQPSPFEQTGRTAAAGTDFPGKTLGLVGLVVAILFNIIGLIISAVAFTQSRKAGFKNTPALIGIIVGAVLTVVAIVVGIASAVAGMAAATLYY